MISVDATSAGRRPGRDIEWSLLQEGLQASRSFVWEVDLDGRFTYLSASVADILEYHPEELVGRTTLDALVFSESPLSQPPGVPQDAELSLATKSGGIIRVAWRGASYCDSAGRPLGFRGLATDVTARRRVDDTLRQTNARMRLAAEAGAMGFWELDVLTDCETWDDGMLRLYGLTHEEFPGTSAAWLSFVHPDDRAAEEAAMKRALQKGEDGAREFRIVHPDGTVRYMAARWVVTRDQSGGVVLMTGMNQDVTDRILDSQRLAASEQKFRLMFEQAPVALSYTDRATGLVRFNEAFEKLFGYERSQPWPREKLAEMMFFRGHPDPAALADWDRMKGEARERGTPVRVEIEVRTCAGLLREVEWVSMPLPGVDLNTVLDVTDRNERLRDVEKSRLLLRAIVDKSPAPICCLEGDSRLQVNEAFTETFGWTTDDLGSLEDWFSKIYPDADLRREVLSGWDGLVERARHADGRIPPMSYLMTAKNGAEHEVEISAMLHEDLVIGTFVDVTERNRAERRIRSSEARLQALIENAPLGIVRMDLPSGRLQANKAMQEIFGYTPEEIPDFDSWLRWAYPDEERRCHLTAEWAEAVAAARAGDGRVAPGEVSVMAKDGRERPMQFSAVIRGDEAFCLWVDLTERSEAQEKLRSSEHRFRTLIGQAPVALSFGTREPNQILYVNRAFEDLFGYTADDITCLDDWLLRAYPDPNYREKVARHWHGLVEKALQENDYVPPAEYRVTCRDGSVREVEISASIIGNFVVPAFVDVTERNRSERLLREQREQLDRAGRLSALGQWAASLAHELDQPLGAILNNAQAADLLLRETGQIDRQELQSIVSDIVDDNQRAGAVLDRIRGMLHRRGLQRHTLTLAGLLADLGPLIRATLASRGIVLEVSCEPDLAPIEGDSVLLQQALLNLVINSIQAIGQRAPGFLGKPGRIQIKAGEVRDGLQEISVVDNGGGIPEELMGQIFQPFCTTKEDGLGIGLPLVQSILEQHGGQVYLDNQPGRGLAVTLLLPVSASGGAA